MTTNDWNRSTKILIWFGIVSMYIIGTIFLAIAGFMYLMIWYARDTIPPQFWS